MQPSAIHCFSAPAGLLPIASSTPVLPQSVLLPCTISTPPMLLVHVQPSLEYKLLLCLLPWSNLLPYATSSHATCWAPVLSLPTHKLSPLAAVSPQQLYCNHFCPPLQTLLMLLCAGHHQFILIFPWLPSSLSPSNN